MKQIKEFFAKLFKRKPVKPVGDISQYPRGIMITGELSKQCAEGPYRLIGKYDRQGLFIVTSVEMLQ